MASGSHVLICGLGQSGLAAARLLRSEGRSVVAVDEQNTPQTNRHRDLLTALGCTVHLGVTAPPEDEFDFAVVSPGLDVNAPFLSAVRRSGIPLISELELGWSRFNGRTLAVTGSNGKSSVVKALAECFEAEGIRAVPCGNYGLPVCQAVQETPEAQWLVIEVSSFQLETCVEFRPDIGLLVNLLPNHLDRHGSMATYAALKARLFARQGKEDVALAPSGWMEGVPGRAAGKGHWMSFGADAAAEYRYEPGRLIEQGGGELLIAGSYFDNEVLGPNAAGLAGAAWAAGLSVETIQVALCRFEPLPHRAQRVVESEGILFIDDSKATNLSAMMASIRMQHRPIWLIAGGRPKEHDFSPALRLLKERVKGVLLVGEAASGMKAAWETTVPCYACGTIERAVEKARELAQQGDVVLLAPACTSYDQFVSYIKRGEAFQQFVSEKG